MDLSPSCQGSDRLVASFNLNCNSILDSIAPFKKVKSKKVAQPWLNAELSSSQAKMETG